MKFVLYEQPKLAEILSCCSRAPEDEREQLEVFNGEKYDADRIAIAFASRTGPSWVIYGNGEPLLVAGFDYIRKGVWQDVMISTPAAWSKENWFAVSRIARRVMDKMMETEAHRLQCVSLRSRIQAHRWYRVLGLRQEGVLEAYGSAGEDALMFSRVKVR